MKYIKMQDTEIPMCMIGTWAWGKGMNGAKMIFGKSYSESDLKQTYDKAVEFGFTLWDTAEVYGMGSAEELLGEFAQGNKEILVSTKCMPKKSYKKGAMTSSLTESSKRLDIEKPFLYWIHLPRNIDKNIAEIIELKRQGKLIHIGVSNFSLDEIKKVHAKLKQENMYLSGVQNHYSLLCRSQEQEDTIKWCRDNDVVYFAYMVLEQGALSGHYSYEKPFALLSNRGLTFTKRKFRKIEPLLALMNELAKSHKVKVAHIAMGWAIKKGTVPIIGLTNASQAEDIAKIMDFDLSEEEIMQLEKAAEATGVIVKGAWE